MSTKTTLLKAKVWHLREEPKHNKFTYSVYYLSRRLRAKEKSKPALLSFNRFNVLSLYNKDLGKKDGTSWLPWAQGEFEKAGVRVADTDDIEVITHPRLFGYAFNPITFWVLLSEYEEIKAVLCEVHNTFGDDHNYVLAHQDGKTIQPEDIFTAPKELYVSPFNTMEGYYTFSFKRSEKEFKTDIVYYSGEKFVLKTAMSGVYTPLTSPKILGVVFSYPLMTVMVVVRIHWQALKLYAKRVRHTLRLRPSSTHGETTRGEFHESK